MTLPPELVAFLPRDTAASWVSLAPLVPKSAYLAGGTAITAHIQHRVSQDLDFFCENTVDLDELAATLVDLGPFAITMQNNHTLSGVYSATKVQFLDASAHRPVDGYTNVGGIRIASMRDLVAMKLKVVGHRGELRDYFDLMAIEQASIGSAEQGLGDYLARYTPKHTTSALTHIVEALGYLDDVDEDELVPAPKSQIASYWQRRQPQIISAAGRLT